MRAFVVLCVLVLTAGQFAFASEEREPRPGFLHRMTHLFQKSPSASREQSVRLKNLELTLEVTPIPLKLSDARQLKVTLKLYNKSHRLVHLEFPTSQRIEALLQDASGKLVTQWSEDQSFENETTYLAINPGERVEYTVNLSTRDMTVGKGYTLEAFFPNFDQLKARRQITPQP